MKFLVASTFVFLAIPAFAQDGGFFLEPAATF
jgi:hypothetical protein